MPLEQNVDAPKSHEESGLKDYEMKVFEKLQTLFTSSVANNYKTVCEIFDEFIENEQREVQSKEKYNNAHDFLTRWIIESEQNSQQVLDLVRHVFQIFIDKDNNDFFQLRTSWLVSATLTSFSQIPNLILDDTWEVIFYELLEYTRQWDMDMDPKPKELFFVESQTNVWKWMIEIACSPMLCPSPYLRLEIFRLIHLFETNIICCYKDVMRNKSIGTAYVECMSSINPEQLFVIMGINLFSMRHLMCNIRLLSLPWILTHLISDKVVEDLHLNQIGKEVRFVANSLKVIGMFAQIAKTRYKAKSKDLGRCLNYCMFLFKVFHNNISENVYNHEVVLPYTCCALADITDGILTLSASINDNDPIKRKQKCMSLYNKIVKQRNDLVNDLDIPKEKFFHVKLCQIEQAGHKFSNILFMKKAALSLTKLQLGTICSDEIEPMSYYHIEEDDDNIERSDVGRSMIPDTPDSPDSNSMSSTYSPEGSFEFGPTYSPTGPSFSPLSPLDDYYTDSDS